MQTFGGECDYSVEGCSLGRGHGCSGGSGCWGYGAFGRDSDSGGLWCAGGYQGDGGRCGCGVAGGFGVVSIIVSMDGDVLLNILLLVVMVIMDFDMMLAIFLYVVVVKDGL